MDSNRILLNISKKYLDIAEQLPKFGGGNISELQSVREMQRRDSQDTYERTRPPVNTSIDLSYIRMFELFQIENISFLLSGINKLFPNPRDKSMFHDIEESSRRLSGSAWWNLGVILKSKGRNYYGGPSYILPSIPKEVDVIMVGLRKVLPSIYILEYDAIINEIGSREYQELQNRKYLPDVKFSTIIPTAMGMSSNVASSVMRNSILEWLDLLRFSVEKPLRPFISGYFTNYSNNKYSHLPAIEVFAVKGDPPKYNMEGKWIEDCYHWWKALGFDLINYQTFTNTKLIYSLNVDRPILGDNIEPQTKIILFIDNFKKRIPNRNGTITNHLLYGNSNDYVTDGEVAISILKLFRYLENKIEINRINVFHNIDKKVNVSFSIAPSIRIVNEILRLSVIVERIELEWDQQKGLINNEIKGLHEFHHKIKKEVNYLDEELLLYVKYKLGFIKAHIKILNDWNIQYLSMRNMSATFGLSIILLIVTFIGIIGLENIRNIIKLLFTIIASNNN